ncbi:DUF4360 domain-containing protein [Actinoplanes xinjiangensis]|uniref:Uncharacterized protein DUF4360 n=1 Tax=Actinoplanes xinjiangensis TaxID=512350 RepID=A0A316G239_9ACTN|nr:DUF4360 domain-containing protein [Actinoplanes xinjiangensis]PWK48447.1 uncharacterized protein DUF4360 [Actinoplanes xinjiangensis]GIF38798.1 hypothetical protein Axi01nite_31090 [Actinoplanes xinjiangensis]
MLHTVATGTALLVSLAATAAVPSSSSASAPTPRRVAVEIVSANGSGCPAGSTRVSASPGGKSFKIAYNEFTASTGPGAAVLDFRKNCQLALDVSLPKGWTWAISRVVGTGSANLRDGATGMQAASYYWSGHSATGGRIVNRFTGPVSGGWQRSNRIAKKRLEYLPCGERRHLNVNFELRVQAGSSTGTNWLAMDSTSSSDFHVVWKRC